MNISLGPSKRSTGYAETNSPTLMAIHIQEAPPISLLNQLPSDLASLPTPHHGRWATGSQWKSKRRDYLPNQQTFHLSGVTVASNPEILNANENVEIHENSLLNSCLYPNFANSASSAERTI